MENEVKENKVKAVIKYSDVKRMLDSGISKKDIANHYGLNPNQMKIAFKKLNLTNTRAKKISFEIVDDREEAPVTEKVVANTTKVEAGKGF